MQLHVPAMSILIVVPDEQTALARRLLAAIGGRPTLHAPVAGEAGALSRSR